MSDLQILIGLVGIYVFVRVAYIGLIAIPRDLKAKDFSVEKESYQATIRTLQANEQIYHLNIASMKSDIEHLTGLLAEERGKNK